MRFEVTAQALHTVRAYDMAAANEIDADLAFALGVRQAARGRADANAEAQLQPVAQAARPGRRAALAAGLAGALAHPAAGPGDPGRLR